MCFHPGKGEDITGERQVDRKPCKGSEATGKQKAEVWVPVKREDFQLWLLVSLEVTPVILRVFYSNTNEKTLFRTVDVICLFRMGLRK